MDAQYSPPIPGHGAFNPYDQPPMLPSETFQPTLHHIQAMSTESLGSYSDFDDPHARAMLPAPPGTARARRRQPQGVDHIKHRRTRSGCYTCRQRRVKCDENRPVCERCRKGKRECSYPHHASSTKPTRSSGKSKDSGTEDASGASGDDYEVDEKEELAPIADDEESEGFGGFEPYAASTSGRKASDASFLAQDKNTSPSTDCSSTFSLGPTRPSPVRSRSKHVPNASISQTSKWSTLNDGIKYFLKYHQHSLSHHHYAFKYDAGNFLKTTYLEIAIYFEPLLFAVVAFSAYHHALTQGNGRMNKFLKYYNQSVSSLRSSLAKSERHSLPTLLTILQLATIEEFLGDWVNLLAHQRAAHQIITELFNPQTIMQSETHRKIINWYIRFDLFAGIMSGSETVLGREWFAACADFYNRQARDKPNDLGSKFEEYFAASRLLATDITLLFAAATKNTVSSEDFATECAKITAGITRFKHLLETAYTDPSCFVNSFENVPPPGELHLSDCQAPYHLYGGELFTMNFVLIDFWAIELMFKYQLLMAQRQQPTSDLTELALKKCKMFEAIEHYDQAPPGAILGCQASLGIASLFLPDDKKHKDWSRRKFALIEQKGYIYPTTMRKRMSDIWGEDVTHWWLPNDEGYPPIIRALREFIEYRALQPVDAMSSDLREMTGIFKLMNVNDHPRAEEMKRLGIDMESSFDPAVLYESSPDQT